MAEPEEKKEQPKKSSKVKLIIILLVGLIALGGGGFFAYTKFFKKKQTEESGAKPEPEKKPADKVILHSMETFIVNLADPGGKRYLKVTMQLELDNQKVLEEISKETPRIRDIILTILSSKEFDDISTLPGKNALKRELVTKLNASLRTGRVLNIYFTEFLVQ
ncbi:MAG: flagellar basal body-associated FliL family protein [Syntrophobacterales bacterium]|nr:flagellar basal body-associated FliL family protein [Syntrophobacterales bacterium]